MYFRFCSFDVKATLVITDEKLLLETNFLSKNEAVHLSINSSFKLLLDNYKDNKFDGDLLYIANF